MSHLRTCPDCGVKLCDWCLGNRQHKNKKRQIDADQQLKEIKKAQPRNEADDKDHHSAVERMEEDSHHFYPLPRYK